MSRLTLLTVAGVPLAVNLLPLDAGQLLTAARVRAGRSARAET